MLRRQAVALLILHPLHQCAKEGIVNVFQRMQRGWDKFLHQMFNAITNFALIWLMDGENEMLEIIIELCFELIVPAASGWCLTAVSSFSFLFRRQSFRP